MNMLQLQSHKGRKNPQCLNTAVFSNALFFFFLFRHICFPTVGVFDKSLQTFHLLFFAFLHWTLQKVVKQNKTKKKTTTTDD